MSCSSAECDGVRRVGVECGMSEFDLAFNGGSVRGEVGGRSSTRRSNQTPRLAFAPSLGRSSDHYPRTPSSNGLSHSSHSCHEGPRPGALGAQKSMTSLVGFLNRDNSSKAVFGEADLLDHDDTSHGSRGAMHGADSPRCYTAERLTHVRPPPTPLRRSVSRSVSRRMRPSSPGRGSLKSLLVSSPLSPFQKESRRQANRRRSSDNMRHAIKDTVLLEKLYDGDHVGVETFLLGRPHTCDIVAIQLCECLLVPRKPYGELMQRFPELTTELTTRAEARALHEANRDEAAFRNVEKHTKLLRTAGVADMFGSEAFLSRSHGIVAATAAQQLVGPGVGGVGSSSSSRSQQVKG